jgi:hypothetical protein
MNFVAVLIPFVLAAAILGFIFYRGIKKLARARRSEKNPPPQDWHIHSLSKVMTLRPNYAYAFLKTFIWFFVIITVFSGVMPHLQGKAVRFDDIFAMAIFGSAFLGIFVAVMFTPREITWNEERIKIGALFPGSGDYEWRQLEAYSPFGKGFATFLIKFEGQQAFQIVPLGFRSDEWKAFQSLLRQRFPTKKTWIWFGPIPVRFGKE